VLRNTNVFDSYAIVNRFLIILLNIIYPCWLQSSQTICIWSIFHRFSNTHLKH